MNNDISKNLQEQVLAAFEKKAPLRIVAGDSKAFFGNTVKGEKLDVSGHSGIVEYHPSELVLTARCGTKLSEIEQTLKENNQMLAFEPPMHSENATFGGAIATGLSGPRRPYAGSARDFVLGTEIINGKGEALKFGGQVMKNVAGYDASRLMTGAQGTLGVLLNISVKVLPLAETSTTLALKLDEINAHQKLRGWINQGHPISASCFYHDTIYIRLCSTKNSVQQAVRDIGGEISDANLWTSLRNQTHEFFQQDSVWRLSLPPATSPIHSESPQLIEWSGAQRWMLSNENLYDTAIKYKGHATRYAHNESGANTRFQPLNSSLLALHKRLKHSFDPAGILNMGRIYSEL